MDRRDIYEEMSRRSYSDAEDYKEQCERHGHSMNERVTAWNRESVQDGCGYSRTGDEAVRAARDIERRKEWQEEERRREEEERESQFRQHQEQWRLEQEMIEQSRIIEEEQRAVQQLPEVVD